MFNYLVSSGGGYPANAGRALGVESAPRDLPGQNRRQTVVASLIRQLQSVPKGPGPLDNVCRTLALGYISRFLRCPSWFIESLSCG